MKREIPPGEWASFLESFTAQHDRWLVSVTIIDQPLESLVARTGEISIAIGPNTRVTVDDPRRIAVESEDGVDSGLTIEDATGRITRVMLRVALALELVDGIA